MSYRIEVAPEFAHRLKNLSKRSLHKSIITQNPADITASRTHFQKPNLKVYLVISIYAISIVT